MLPRRSDLEVPMPRRKRQCENEPEVLLDTLLAEATGHSQSPGKVVLCGETKAPESNVMELFLLTFVVSKHPDMLTNFIDKVAPSLNFTALALRTVPRALPLFTTLYLSSTTLSP